MNNYEFLDHGDFSDDDFVKDPDYVRNKDDLSESSDENDLEVETIINVADTNTTNNFSFNTLANSNENFTNRPTNIAQTDSSTAASTSDNNITQSGRPKKGRKRKNCEYTLSGRKQRKYDNLPYKTDSNKVVVPKVFKRSICSCNRQCFACIPEEDQKREFANFYNLRSYEAQLLYIVSNVKETKAKRHYVLRNPKSGKGKPREYSRKYSIGNTEVCKDMFVNTFQISCRIIDTV